MIPAPNQIVVLGTLKAEGRWVENADTAQCITRGDGVRAAGSAPYRLLEEVPELGVVAGL